MLARRLLLSWLVALTLLFGQAAAFAHSLSHLGTHDPALPDPTCEVCIAQANLGSAAPPQSFVLPEVPADPVGAPVSLLLPVRVVVQSAQARAPPAPSETRI
jgi:hypothetical protein